ncbi:efflux transporter, RND family [Rhodopirellula maiorica SM1]|uniref:Efflux transporter, RND family n=1 Tax=Rhodopirellula maiorica SM1 TaxID=1265738 RepID=M5RQ74_9BACT|nr:efflux RND transporter periplasmic adaptor subunit [Rhodopirellula maiorica]EMI21351.1 efflux transporter, RND family [Rhodopirellula maiorica SM1]
MNSIQHCISFALMTTWIASSSITMAGEAESFTEPYKRVDVPAAEIGILAEIRVTEGDEVYPTQLLAQLDDSVLRASLEVAKSAKDATGSRLGATLELASRQKQLASYKELRERGNASVRELDRSETEYQQAKSRLQSINEELEVRRLEYERVKAQIKQRRIESPIAGVVVEIRKEQGEFVSPTDPVVMQIVQLDELKAVFSVPLDVAASLAVEQQVTLLVGHDAVPAAAVIEYVSPVADAESGSVRVKIRIPNRDRQLQSGVVARWQYPDTAAGNNGLVDDRMPSIRHANALPSTDYSAR